MDLTVLLTTRHGHGTAALVLERLVATTPAPFRVVFADIASPPPVAAYLARQARERAGFTHLRFEAPVSRQVARKRALERVQTPLVALLDNNVTSTPGWLDALERARAETGAALVSPLVVSGGEFVHFSGGRVVRRRRLRPLGRDVRRPQTVADAPFGARLSEVAPVRRDVDFVESHGCLAETASLRLPGVLDEALHNAHTMCFAGYTLRRHHGRRVVVEPGAVVSIVPLAFGYDLPWLLSGYLDPRLLATSYRRLASLLGPGAGTSFAWARPWHRKHLAYLLLSMLERDRLARTDFAAPEEVPTASRGYDQPLPADAGERIREAVLPFVEARHPALVGRLRAWLDAPGAPARRAG